MNDNDIAKFKELFLQTASVYLKDLETNLLAYSEDKNNTTAVENVYLASHSLAGQSSMMGFVGISSFAGVVEKAFRAKKEQNREVSDEEIELIEKSIKRVYQSIADIKNGKKELVIPEEVAKLKESISI